MVEAFRSDVRANAASAQRVLDSETYGAVLSNTDNLNMVVMNVNRLLDDLAQPSGVPPVSLLGGAGARQADINSQRKSFQTLSAAQKEDLRDRLLVLFAGEAMHGNASMSELQAVVHEKLTGVLELASAAPVTQPVEAPAEPGFFERIGGDIVAAFRSIIPSPTQMLDVELDDGSMVTIGESEARQMLLTAGISEDTIDAFFRMSDIGTDDKVALFWLLNYSNGLNELFESTGGMPSAVTPTQMQEAWDRSLYATLGFMQSNFGDEYAERGTNLPEVQAAGITGVRSILGSIIVASGIFSLIGNELDPFSPQRVSTYTNAVAAVRAEVFRAIIEPKQKILKELTAELENLQKERTEAATRRGGTQVERTVGIEEAEIARLDTRIAAQQAKVDAAKVAVEQASARAESVLEAFKEGITHPADLQTADGLRAEIQDAVHQQRSLDDALTRSTRQRIDRGNLNADVIAELRRLDNPEVNQLLDELEIASGRGRFGMAVEGAFAAERAHYDQALAEELEKVGKTADTATIEEMAVARRVVGERLKNPIDVLQGIDTRLLERTLNVGRINSVLVLEVNGVDISVANRGAVTPSTSVWARMFVDPWRGAGLRSSTAFIRLGAAPLRTATSILREAFSGSTKGAKVAGWTALIGMIEVSWMIDYRAGMTDVPDPFTWAYRGIFGGSEPSAARQPAQRSSTTASAQAVATTQTEEQRREAQARPLAKEIMADYNNLLRLGNGTYMQMRDPITQYLQASFGSGEEITEDALAGFDLDRLNAVKNNLHAMYEHMRTSHMSAQEAERYFYSAFFTNNNAGKVVTLIDKYVPEAERLDVYQDLFQSTLQQGAYGEDIIQVLAAMPRFKSIAEPLLRFAEASIPATSETARMNALFGILLEANLINQLPVVDLSLNEVAESLARSKLVASAPNLVARIDAFVPEAGRFDAYLDALSVLRDRPNTEERVLLTNLARELGQYVPGADAQTAFDMLSFMWAQAPPLDNALLFSARDEAIRMLWDSTNTRARRSIFEYADQNGKVETLVRLLPNMATDAAVDLLNLIGGDFRPDMLTMVSDDAARIFWNLKSPQGRANIWSAITDQEWKAAHPFLVTVTTARNRRGRITATTTTANDWPEEAAAE
jgi:hypothetical protein